jgi:hypothetical protein
MRVGLLSLGLAAALMASAEIRVASWNMNNLHHQLDEPLRPGAPARTGADIEILRKYRDRADADIFALQEVNGPRAAQLVFPTDRWDLDPDCLAGLIHDHYVDWQDKPALYIVLGQQRAVQSGVGPFVPNSEQAAIYRRHADEGQLHSPGQACAQRPY